MINNSKKLIGTKIFVITALGSMLGCSSNESLCDTICNLMVMCREDITESECLNGCNQ